MSRWGWVWSTLGVMGLAAVALTACSDEPGAPPGECTADVDCDDGSSCTVDLCKTGGICESVPQPGEICDDADACTVGELCDAEGVCSGGEPVDLTSGPCEVCVCDPTDGVACHPRNHGDSCDDGDCCTLSDTCKTCDPATDEGCGDSGMLCGGVDKDCGDENECTDDSCTCDDLGIASCASANVEDGTVCVDNPNLCTLGDSCMAGQCIPGDPLPLDDSNPCTADTCLKGVVDHVALNEGQCDDGNECTIDDYCLAGTCVGVETVECVKESCASSVSCVPGQGCVQVWLPEGSSCLDASLCTEEGTCDGEHVCVTEPVVCDDGNPCTADGCDAESGCYHEAAEVLNGVPCAPVAPCAASGECQQGACVPVGDPSCDDGDPCTVDSCDPVLGCGSVPDASTDGLACAPEGPCVVAGACQGGACVGSEELDCDDGSWCTEDTCDPDQGCIYTLDETNTVSVDCSQVNDIDDGKCCCWAEDPTGVYQSAHVLDVGSMPAGSPLSLCVATGTSAGCSANVSIDVSEDGLVWETVKTFAMTSVPKDGGGWVQVCHDITVSEVYRYVRTGVDSCYVDYVSASACSDTVAPCVLTGDAACDDENPCTSEFCDVTAGCVYSPVYSAQCMVLKYGNNLVSFHTLPTDGDFKEALKPVIDDVWRIMGEGTLAMQTGAGLWFSNLPRLERNQGYWVTMTYSEGIPWKAFPLEGEATDADLSYPLHQGLNSVSFSGAEGTPVTDALPDAWEGLFTHLIGEGIAAFAFPDGWGGSLTKLQPNRGYEVMVEEAIPGFHFDSASADGEDDTSYGCLDPHAINYDAGVDVDDGSCTFDVPPWWKRPFGTEANKAQAWVVFHGLTVGGEALEPEDAVASFIDGESAGFGFPEGDSVMMAAMNGSFGDVISFQIHDASTGEVVPVLLPQDVQWDQNQLIQVGCTDAAADNFVEDAIYELGNCVDP